MLDVSLPGTWVVGEDMLSLVANDAFFFRSRAIIIRNGEIIPMSSEFTPETERQRLQYLVRVVWVWQRIMVVGAVSKQCERNTLL